MSAFAAEGGTLEPALKIASKDIVVYDKDARSGGIAKATVVEGLIAEALGQCKGALDGVYYEQAEMPREQAIVSAFKLMGMELLSLVSLLEGYHAAALRPKHRACRQIVVGMVDRMKANDIQEGAAEGGLVAFAKDAVRFLECMHVCMLEETDRKKRHRWKKRFLDG